MKALSRRRFFAAAAGAAAAPSVAGQIQTAPGSSLVAPPTSYGTDVAGAPKIDPFYWANRQKEIERHIRGEFSEDEIAQFQMDIGPDAVPDANITALRSVSASAKINMHRAVRVRRHSSRWIENAKRELAQIIKQRLGLGG